MRHKKALVEWWKDSRTWSLVKSWAIQSDSQMRSFRICPVSLHSDCIRLLFLMGDDSGHQSQQRPPSRCQRGSILPGRRVWCSKNNLQDKKCWLDSHQSIQHIPKSTDDWLKPMPYQMFWGAIPSQLYSCELQVYLQGNKTEEVHLRVLSHRRMSWLTNQILACLPCSTSISYYECMMILSYGWYNTWYLCTKFLQSDAPQHWNGNPNVRTVLNRVCNLPLSDYLPQRPCVLHSFPCKGWCLSHPATRRNDKNTNLLARTPQFSCWCRLIHIYSCLLYSIRMIPTEPPASIENMFGFVDIWELGSIIGFFYHSDWFYTFWQVNPEFRPSHYFILFNDI